MYQGKLASEVIWEDEFVKLEDEILEMLAIEDALKQEIWDYVDQEFGHLDEEDKEDVFFDIWFMETGEPDWREPKKVTTEAGLFSVVVPGEVVDQIRLRG
jgi:hypothetical protein